MDSPRFARSGLQSPRGWLFLAFLGVWLYLASQLLRLYPARVAEVVVLPVSEVRELLALSAGLGQLLFFGGLVAALWRANLAAGVSNAGIRGLAFGVAGVGILGVFEFASSSIGSEPRSIRWPCSRRALSWTPVSSRAPPSPSRVWPPSSSASRNPPTCSGAGNAWSPNAERRGRRPAEPQSG